jgi:mannonate dehydratase
MDRRDVLRRLPAGALLGCSLARGVTARGAAAPDQTKPDAPRGLPPLKINDVVTILTAPNKIRLVIVMVKTSEPGLYGLGCATFTQRANAVQVAVEKYLKPFLIGRDPDQIEDIWQSSYVTLHSG